MIQFLIEFSQGDHPSYWLFRQGYGNRMVMEIGWNMTAHAIGGGIMIGLALAMAIARIDLPNGDSMDAVINRVNRLQEKHERK